MDRDRPAFLAFNRRHARNCVSGYRCDRPNCGVFFRTEDEICRHLRTMELAGGHKSEMWQMFSNENAALIGQASILDVEDSIVQPKEDVESEEEGDTLKPPITGLTVFTSTPDKKSNKHYLGPAPSEEMARSNRTNGLWVFGHGSLIWNPGFEYDEKVIGFIKDCRRVFDVACIDRRGTPEHPARTCSLEHKEGSVCWGAAYCVRGGPEKEKAAMEYLERRECECDQKTLVDFYAEGDTLKPPITGMIVFTSTPDKKSNKYYLGPAPLEEMGRQIATAVGPCGKSRDYLFALEKAMFDIGHEDDCVIELANEVRKVLGVIGIGAAVPKENKLVAPPHIPIPIKSHISALQLRPHPEAITMDS